MKVRGASWVIAGFMGLFLLSCFDPPEYSNTPAIVFENVTFVDVPNSSDPDSLIISVRFKDGDGDMGLDANSIRDTLCPYNARFFFDTVKAATVPYYCPSPTCYVNDPNTCFVENSPGPPDEVTFITYKTFRTNRYGWGSKLSYDTLPEFKKPYNCVNWEIRSVNNEVDTFYFERNPYHYNIFVKYFVKQNNGTFKEFDWVTEFAYPQCGITFDGRFPVLSKDLGRAAALDGTIRYGMASTGFNFLFSTKTMYLEVTVFDRLLNQSNTVQTEPFTLQQIKK